MQRVLGGNHMILSKFHGYVTVVMILLFLLTSCSNKTAIPSSGDSVSSISVHSTTSVSSYNGNIPAVGSTTTTTGSIQDITPLVELKSVSFISASIGYLLCGDTTTHTYKLIKTINGGKDWQDVVRDQKLNYLKFISENNGYAIQEKNLVRTNDGGKTWNAVNTPEGPPYDYYCVVNENLFFCFCTNQKTSVSSLFKSTDGGKIWTSVNTPVDWTLEENGIGGLSFVSENEGYMLDSLQSGAGTQMKTLYHTKNGGKSWEKLAWGEIIDGHMKEHVLPASGYSAGIQFFLDGTGYFGETRGGIYKTTDSGKTFQLTFEAGDQPSPVPDFINEKEGFGILGGAGSSLIHTKDGGVTWESLYPKQIMSVNSSVDSHR